jgi:hypothetical protein
MKLTKKELNEIIDSNGDLIGSDDTPRSGSDLDTQANNTTDQNVQKGNQPFRYDMLGRFGFTLLPFFEGEENQEQTELLNDVSKELFGLYKTILEYYYRNPNRIKSEYRQISQHENGDGVDLINSYIKDNFGQYAQSLIKVFEKHFEGSFKQPENIDESTVFEEKVIEDKVIDKKSEDEISKKSKDNDVKDKQVEKIAGLINKKFEKDDIDKLINLLEAKKIQEETEFSEEDKKKIKDFVRNYKGNFDDEDIHKFSDEIGLDKHEVEEYIYSIARKELNR